MLRLAFGQLRLKLAVFAGVATAIWLAVTVISLFALLFVAGVSGPPVKDGEPGLLVLAGGFGELAIFAALFVVANTLSFAVREQHRELALLRTVGREGQAVPPHGALAGRPHRSAREPSRLGLSARWWRTGSCRPL